MTPIVWIAIAGIVGQGVLIGALLYVIATFGAFAKARDRDAKTQQNQNLMIQMQNWNLSKDIASIRAEQFAKSSQERSA